LTCGFPLEQTSAHTRFARLHARNVLALAVVEHV
jgi:hypothetical protein